jgi:hypothetical protein
VHVDDDVPIAWRFRELIWSGLSGAVPFPRPYLKWSFHAFTGTKLTPVEGVPCACIGRFCDFPEKRPGAALSRL